jgi:hypothetical protein
MFRTDLPTDALEQHAQIFHQDQTEGPVIVAAVFLSFGN